MKKEELKSVINALEESLSLILEEYESLRDDELRKKYEGVVEKLQNAIKQVKTYD